ncbi:hypothetical protein F4810DRAFT_670607 [Camillea tinctor]|nr:hypothetical protein F4810DRAFT_670607 [Camillea tinctor]
MNEPKIISDFIDHTPLIGDPETTLAAFKNIKLRRFPAPVEDIEWLKYLGHGNEGHVYLARINRGHPVAMKVFWHASRPPPDIIPKSKCIGGGNYYLHKTFPFKTESRIVDLMQKIAAAMSEVEKNPGQPIMIVRGPKERQVAKENVYAFSKERREEYSKMGRTSSQPFLPKFPRFPECKGWLMLKNSDLPEVDPPLPKRPDRIGWSPVIVYEYVPEAEVNFAFIQEFLDFFYELGFVIDIDVKNWRGGRLVDMNDIRLPFDRRWFPEAVFVRNAEDLEWFDVEKEPLGHKIHPLIS